MIGKILAALAIVIIILAVALAISNGIQSKYHQQLPNFPDINNTVPPQFSNILSQPSSQTSAQLSSLTKRGTANVPQSSIIYNGSVYVKPSGLIGAFTQVNSPIYAGESRYGKDVKMYVNVTSLPVLGTWKIIYLNITNGTFTCTNFNMSAISEGNFAKALSGNKNITCARTSTLAGINFSQIAEFNMSQFSKEGLLLNYETIYQSTYKGAPCTYMAGNITNVKSSTGSPLGNGAFEICISDRYYVPVSLSMYLTNSSYRMSANINETYISNSSEESFVTSMPATG